MDTLAIGEFIKTNRKKLSMTQLDLGNALGVSPQAVSKWERGECLPDISLLPDVSRVFSVKLEDILNAGEKTELNTIEKFAAGLNAFIDEELFSQIKSAYKSAETINDLVPTPDIFLFLSNSQKEELLEIIFRIPDYTYSIDDLLPYLNNNALRQKLAENILFNKKYELLEPLMPFFSNNIKLIILSELLNFSEFGVIEEIITMLSREHKNLIINYVLQNHTDTEALENLIPFFDKKQRALIEENL